MNNQINENFLETLVDTLQTERNAVILDLKNDKDLSKTKDLSVKLCLLESMIKNTIKYRNILIKHKMKSIS